MNRAEIIEGLKDIYGTLYANYYFRKALDLKIIEACLKLLESENALIDRVLEVIDKIDDYQVIRFGSMAYGDGKDELRRRILALKGGEQE